MTALPAAGGAGGARLERHGVLLAAAGFALVALLGVAARPLLPIDETRYLAVAWEMRVTGDWLVPHLNGAIYTHKPPLLFWLINLVWAVTGPSETAARLVGPAFGVAAMIGTGRLARRLWPDDPDVGGRAALVLAGFAVFTLYGGLTMFDAILTCAVLLGVGAVADPARPRVALFGVALALGAFAKGPVILVHLVPVWFAATWLAGAPAGASLRRFAAAFGVGLGIVLLWLVPAILLGGPEYRDAVLWTQSAGRVANPFDHGRPFWFFAALLPLVLWPWVWMPALWPALARLDLRGDGGTRLCVAWAAATLVLFSLIASKQLHYLLPALPAAALVFARALGPGTERRAVPAGLVPLALGVGLIALALDFAPDPETARLARPGWTIALPGALLIGLAAAALRLRGCQVAGLGLGLVVALNLVFPFGAPGRIYDAHPMARAIAPHDGRGIAFLGPDYAGQFSFAARLRHPVDEPEDLAAALAWLAAHPEGILIARLDRDHPDAEPTARIDYRDASYGLWPGTPAPR